MAEGRLKSYKNKGLDAAELRRRREEEGIQIRKSKREDELSKRRNTQKTPDDTEFKLSYGNSNVPVLERLAADVSSNDAERHRIGCRGIRSLLTKDGPPVDDVIAMGIVPRLVEFVHSHDDGQVQFEAAWALTNVASGSSMQTRVVVEAGAVPVFVEALGAASDDVKEQVIWALGNIAGDGPDCRDYVIQCSIIRPLLEILSTSNKIPMLRNAVWTLSNLCRGKSPAPDFQKVSLCLPFAAKLLYHPDHDILVDMCWTLTFLSDGPNYKIQALIDSGVSRRLIELLLHEESRVVAPALRAVGNIVTGDDVQTQVMLNCSALPSLLKLLSHHKTNIQKEACWALSNVTAGNRAQIQAVIDANVFPSLLDNLAEGGFSVRKEALWTFCNAFSGGSPIQIKYLASIGCVKPICDMLTVADTRIVLVALEALEQLLKVGEEDAKHKDGVNPYSVLIEEACGLEKIEFLQTQENEEIYQKAFHLIETYFEDKEDAEETACKLPNFATLPSQ